MASNEKQKLWLNEHLCVGNLSAIAVVVNPLRGVDFNLIQL